MQYLPQFIAANERSQEAYQEIRVLQLLPRFISVISDLVSTATEQMLLGAAEASDDFFVVATFNPISRIPEAKCCVSCIHLYH